MDTENIKILLVDDEIDCANNLASELSSRNINVSVTNDGAAAIEMAKFSPPDLIILDVEMPEMNGFTVLQNIRKIHTNVLVVMLSEHKTDQDEATAFSMGASSLLQKPVDIDELIDNIKMTLGDKMEHSLVVASLAEGGDFITADEVIAEAELIDTVVTEIEIVDAELVDAESVR